MEKMQTLEKKENASMRLFSWENGALDGLKGKASKVMKILVMTTALNAAIAENAEAQKTNSPVRTEHQEDRSQKIEWAKQALIDAKNELKNIGDSQDARIVAIKIAKPFSSHIGILSNGGENAARYSQAEYKALSGLAHELYSILEDLDNRYEINRANSLDHVIHILDMKSEYSGYQLHEEVLNRSSHT
jgi:hypothetical protein